MKTALSLAVAALIAFAALVVVVNHLDGLSGAMCRSEFTLPDMACRFGSLGLAFLMVPLSGAVAFFVIRRVFRR